MVLVIWECSLGKIRFIRGISTVLDTFLLKFFAVYQSLLTVRSFVKSLYSFNRIGLVIHLER